jgi:peptidoglycan hydrolase-like protein with peptidoglycan-binding domain
MMGGPAYGRSTNLVYDQQVYNMQVLLNRFFGYARLVVDGKKGDNTTAAVKEFQAAKHLPVTGNFDSPTHDALVKVTGTAVSSTPNVCAPTESADDQAKRLIEKFPWMQRGSMDPKLVADALKKGPPYDTAQTDTDATSSDSSSEDSSSSLLHKAAKTVSSLFQ